jgi:CheY-like chemotaxis protein
MGGELTLKSKPLHGSCFSFCVDLELAHRPAKILSKKEPTRCLQHHILLVDDTQMVRTVTAQMLEILGYTVVTASSGKEAIDIVENEDFDLILMDCKMPKMDGLEATERLLRLHPHRKLRIAALTAHATLSDVERSKKSGMIGQLNKPFTLSEIQTFIQQMETDYPRHRN